MEHNTPPSKLDEVIKENLSNYDAKYDAGDWSRMERMLDATPKSIAPKSSYNIAMVVGAAVLIGGFLLYKGMNSSETTPVKPVDTTVTTTPVENKTETSSKPVPAAVVAKTTPVVVKEQPAAIPVTKKVVPEVKNSVADAKEKTLVEKTKTEKEKQQKNAKLDPAMLKNQKVSVMGKEPIFGDQLDASKGIVRETKEKESTKKAAVSKGANTAGLGLGALLLNVDSIKKQQERMQKDSVHN